MKLKTSNIQTSPSVSDDDNDVILDVQISTLDDIEDAFHEPVDEDDASELVSDVYEDDIFDEESESEMAAEEESKRRKEERKARRLENKTVNYVDGDALKQKIVMYYETNIMTKELADDIRKIADRLCSSMRFANYTYRDEMAADAFLKSYMAIYNKKFDVNRGFSPFSYITQICYNACIFRIKTEKGERAKIDDYRDERYDIIKCNTFDPVIDYHGSVTDSEAD